MVLGEVGQQCQLNAGTRQALLCNTNGAGFNGAVRDSCRHKFSKLRLQQHRIGGGHARVHQCGGLANAQRAHNGTSPRKRCA